MGWSDLGWAMENLWVVLMGRRIILHKDINNKSKQNYPNYQIQMMLLKPVLCFIQQQEVVESQQIQPTGGQLSIVIGDECVSQAWWNYVCQYSAGVYLQCSFLQVYFIIKLYFPI